MKTLCYQILMTKYIKLIEMDIATDPNLSLAALNPYTLPFIIIIIIIITSSSSVKSGLEPQANAFLLLSMSVVTTSTDGRQKYGGWAFSDRPYMFFNAHQSQRHGSTHPLNFNQVRYHLYICRAQHSQA